MNSLLNEAIERVQVLPEKEQEKIALLIMEALKTQENNSQEDLVILDEWDSIIQDCQIDTGIRDLAYQHDHYLYGTAKKELE